MRNLYLRVHALQPTPRQRIVYGHLADDIVAKVRSGESITAADIDELQRVLVAAGIGDTDTFAQASEHAGSFGLFIRSIAV